MLSILIPCYNYNVTRLASELHRQAEEQVIDFELIVMEDGSTQCVEENHQLVNLEFCKHIALAQNVGRSAIRNKLADEARFEHLLFMDCDAEVCSSHFIEKYLAFCKEDAVVVGGTVYDPREVNPRYSLRLKYGREREAMLLQKCISHAHSSEMDKPLRLNFATFNFLIPKSIFNKIRFHETLKSYGHEDTLFGYQLRMMGHEVLYIDNPLIHKGLDDNAVFVKKTELATANLYALYFTGNYPFLVDESKLLKTFCKVKTLGLVSLFAFKFKIISSLLYRNLISSCPSLLVYDIYKLLYMCSLDANKMTTCQHS